jgi:NAD(P)-dependent dehydrogenase (short-subunit alcohol dehydrogenase family)
MMNEATVSHCGKTALVTGCNSGIGFETGLALCELGFRVIVHCRTRDKAESTLNRIRKRFPEALLEAAIFDLSELKAVDEAGRKIAASCDSLDVLINNAGALFKQRSLTPDGLEAHFGINHLAPFHLTLLLLPLLKKASRGRIVNVSSVNHFVGRIRFEDLQCEKRYFWATAYGTSKLAVICTTHELARRLQGSGVTANSLDPGLVSTNIFLKEGTLPKKILGPPMDLLFLSPREGARTSVYLAASPEVEGISGKYFVRCREHRSSRASYDEKTAIKLWSESEKLITDILEGHDTSTA